MNYNCSAVELGDKERLDSEQPGKSEPCLVTNSPVYIINNLALVNNFLMTKGSVSPRLTVFMNNTQKEGNKDTDCDKNCLNQQKKPFFVQVLKEFFFAQIFKQVQRETLVTPMHH